MNPAWNLPALGEDDDLSTSKGSVTTPPLWATESLPDAPESPAGRAKESRTGNDQTTPGRFPHIWLKDAQVDFENTDIVKRLIPGRGLVLVYGPSGDGKTFWTIDLACHVASGQEWRGKRVRRSLVIYIAAEAGTSIVRRFVACGTQDIPLAIITRGANLLDLKDVDALLWELKSLVLEAGLPVGMVVFDTYSRSMPGGDENGPQDVTQVIAAADRLRDELGATTLFVHHSGKDEARGARGWNGLYAAADCVINVIDKVASVKKSRDGASDESFPFALRVVDLGEDSDGDLLTTCVVEHSDAASGRPPSTKALPATAGVAFTALQEAINEDGMRLPETSSIPRGTVAVTLAVWRDRFKLRFGNDDDVSFRQAFRRSKADLLKAGRIQILDPNVWLT